MKKLLIYLMAITIINTAQSQSWTINGNGNINPATHFLGTTNNQPLKFRINNKYAGEIDSVNGKAFFGYGAGKVSTGTDNVAIGFKAFNSNTTGTYNTANGSNALYSNTTASGNTANGSYALYSNTTGNQNTANGTAALYLNTTGSFNTANGDHAMNLNTTGYENTATGSFALYSNTTGYYNVANGYASLYSNTTGNFNTANGYQSLYSNTTGYYNVANGYQSLYSNTTGFYNTANGLGALYSNTTGGYNTANGGAALYSNTTGAYNTANSSNALYSNTTGSQNTANGYAALFLNTTGTNNVANGYAALFSNTTGNNNTANGTYSLYYCTNGIYNSAYGANCLYRNTSGSYNAGVGTNSLNNNTTGGGNSALGYNSLIGSTTGSQNTAVGMAALGNNTTGSNNTAIGYSALASAINAQYNTAIGFGAGYNYQLGSSNTILGANSGGSFNGQFNMIAVGQGVTCTANNSARIGNSATTSIGGYVGWTNFSDGRYKRNIKENVKGLEFIMKLRPVTYNLDITGASKKTKENAGEEWDARMKEAIAEKEKTIFSGFVAQEVEQAAKETGYDFSGVDKPQRADGVYGLRYAEFVVPLVKAIQEQQQMIDELKKQNADLLTRMTALEKNSNKNSSFSHNEANTLTVRPNPSGDMIFISIISESSSQAILRLYDSKGALVKQSRLSFVAGKNEVNMDLKGFISGTYLLSAEWDNGQMKKTVPVIKQ